MLKRFLSKERYLWYFGDKHTLQVVSESANRVLISEGKLLVCPVEQSWESVLRSVNRWLNAELEQYMIPRVHELSKQMGLEYTRVGFRSQRTRWGSRSSSGTINFNYALIHTPKEVIDYVIIHELSHIRHMDHSFAFWEHVGRFDPHYRHRRRWLRQNELEIQKMRGWLVQ